MIHTKGAVVAMVFESDETVRPRAAIGGAGAPGTTGWCQRFSSTRRGARLARRMTLVVLAEWGHAHDDPAADRVALVVAELASNAVKHGQVRGRDFELRLVDLPDRIRLEVSDARGDKRPVAQPPHVGEDGYGLCLITAMAEQWGVADRVVGKTVWAEIAKRRSTSMPDCRGAE
ncbi:ATP-binding protein [Streptomyces sp. LP05-1]|uniref:ATP-binding protein n=1 Tax=Streptomyces pyxinae TaxID=2970734 RepID=A0ABT2CI10_9ACTN|nr:ATP-binding protein [Streptomyces sp. LP05-1]MCS0637040.1 ATP-binding protein [Streptomyces sp. LP05-1]